MPGQFKEWLKLFNGGFLFNVSMVSTHTKFSNHFNHLVTFEEVNTEKFKENNLIPTNYVNFAITNYGNIICYDKTSSNEYIYEWDTDEDCIVRQWDSFAEWLEERLLKAKKAIEENLLEIREGKC